MSATILSCPIMGQQQQGMGQMGMRSGGMGMGAFANLAIISGTVSTALGNLGDKSEKASDAQFAMAVTGEKAGQLLMVRPLLAITMLKFDKAIKAGTNKTNENKTKHVHHTTKTRRFFLNYSFLNSEQTIQNV